MKNYDFVIVGGGIVGLTIGRALALRQAGSVLILEKESELGCHASGKNSGVLHAGIYYGSDSFKTKVCATGAGMMRDYAVAHGIEVLKTGKVIVAASPEREAVVDILYKRAQANGARIEKITPGELSTLEPLARTCGSALFSPDTSVIDPRKVLDCLEEELKNLGVNLLKATQVMFINTKDRCVHTSKEQFGYGHLVNAAGLHADRIAHLMGAGKKYRILPFKGIYAKLRSEISKQIHRAIYPVPDLEMPFLGVHLTKTVQGDVLVGPTAIPALGRENYGLLDGLNLRDSSLILFDLAKMWIKNNLNFRRFVKEEVTRYLPGGLLKSTRELVPSLGKRDFLPGTFKVGVRAQLVEIETKRLVMDFLVEDGPSSTHILNAVSPAFTGSFYFAELMADRILQAGKTLNLKEGL